MWLGTGGARCGLLGPTARLCERGRLPRSSFTPVLDFGEMDRLLATARRGYLLTRVEDNFFWAQLPLLFDPTRRVLAGHITLARQPPRTIGQEAAAILRLRAFGPEIAGPNVSSRYPGRLWRRGFQTAHAIGELAWRSEREWVRRHLADLARRATRSGPFQPMGKSARVPGLAPSIDDLVGVELRVEELLLSPESA